MVGESERGTGEQESLEEPERTAKALSSLEPSRIELLALVVGGSVAVLVLLLVQHC